MNTYKFDSIVSKGERDALKEMIFRRAKERAEALTEEVQSSYTSSVQNDVMELARDSFISSRNPFSQQQEEKPVEAKIEEPKSAEIGFAKRHVEEIKTQAATRSKVMSGEIANKELEANMANARADFSRKQSFMGALEFLNSQASISLVKSQGHKFEALA